MAGPRVVVGVGIGVGPVGVGVGVGPVRVGVGYPYYPYYRPYYYPPPYPYYYRPPVVVVAPGVYAAPPDYAAPPVYVQPPAQSVQKRSPSSPRPGNRRCTLQAAQVP